MSAAELKTGEALIDLLRSALSLLLFRAQNGELPNKTDMEIAEAALEGRER